MPVAVTAKAVRRAAPCCRCPFLLPAGRFPPFFAENTPHAHIRHTLFRRAAKCAPDTFAKRKKPGRMLRPGFCGAGDRDRTGTGFLPWDFKSQASANSATPAFPGRHTLKCLINIARLDGIVNPLF